MKSSARSLDVLVSDSGRRGEETGPPDRPHVTHPSHDTLEEEEAPSNITNNDDGDDESGGGGGESCGVRRRGRPSPADLA